MRKNGTAVNIDGDIFYWIYSSCDGRVDDVRDTLSRYVEGYAGRGISDLLFCCFCQNSLFPTDVLSWRGDKLQMKEEAGKVVDYTGSVPVVSVVEMWRGMEGDPIAFMLSETKRHGMRAWLSVRMNDAHRGQEHPHWLHGRLFDEAMEKDLFIGDVSGHYFEKCFDYGAEFVRDKMYAYLCECLDKYDVDGLELDFMREIFCFDYKRNPECHKIMTEFLAKVRGYVRQRERERGHAIRLAVRLCRDIEDNKIFGFDVAEWIRRDLVDVLIPSPRWTSTDSDMPIDRWKAEVKGKNIEIWVGLETHLMSPYLQSEETVRGFAKQYFDEGADKIYLYNYFRLRSKNMDEDAFRNSDMQRIYQKALKNDENIYKMWKICSDKEALENGKRRHIVTYQENATKPYRKGEYHPLPIAVSGYERLSVATGSCHGNRVTVLLGICRGDTPPVLTVDGTVAYLLGESRNAYVQCADVPYENTDFYEYSAIPDAGNIRELLFEGDDVIVVYVELLVEP